LVLARRSDVLSHPLLVACSGILVVSLLPLSLTSTHREYNFEHASEFSPLLMHRDALSVHVTTLLSADSRRAKRERIFLSHSHWSFNLSAIEAANAFST